MKNENCGDKIDIFEYNLSEMPEEALRSLLSVVSSCTDCRDCEGQVELLKKYLSRFELASS